MKNKTLTLLCFIFTAMNISVYSQTGTKHNAKINHLAIYVADLQKSGDFYKTIIGLDTIPEPFHDGKHLWFHIGPGISLHIIEGAEIKKEYFKANHICFSVSSVDAFTDMLKKKGISFEDFSGSKNNKINIRPDGVKQIWLQDPDGYWIEINDARN